MINAILDIVRSWHMFFQCVFVVALVSTSGIVILTMLNVLGTFFNETLTTWFRGYPPSNNEEDKE